MLVLKPVNRAQHTERNNGSPKRIVGNVVVRPDTSGGSGESSDWLFVVGWTKAMFNAQESIAPTCEGSNFFSATKNLTTWCTEGCGEDGLIACV
ncbi:hypothetical protein HG531_012108 [Fusarium graminearum]|nr:hypothetical protein HG531_012108 [Fusarium graminearum]